MPTALEEPLEQHSSLKATKRARSIYKPMNCPHGGELPALSAVHWDIVHYLWAVCLTVHSLNSSSEVPTAVSMLVCGVRPRPSAVARARRSTWKTPTGSVTKGTHHLQRWTNGSIKIYKVLQEKSRRSMLITHIFAHLVGFLGVFCLPVPAD